MSNKTEDDTVERRKVLVDKLRMKYNSAAAFELYKLEMEKSRGFDESLPNILLSALNAVITGFTDVDDQFIPPPINHIHSADGEFVEMHHAAPGANFQSLLRSADDTTENLEGHLVNVDAGDSCSLHSKRLHACPNCKNSRDIEKLIQFEKSAIVRSQVSKIMKDKNFLAKPTMTVVERGIKETELLSFSSLCASDLYRNNQLQECFQLVLQNMKMLPNFTGTVQRTDGDNETVVRRKFYRHLTPLAFAQCLIEEDQREPEILSGYYPMTDDLLYVLSWPPPPRRNKLAQWQYNMGPLLTGLEEEPNPDKETFEVATRTLTPAGRSLAMIKQIKNSVSKFAWLSIHINGSLVGLRVCFPYSRKPIVEEETPLRSAKSIKSRRASKLGKQKSTFTAKRRASAMIPAIELIDMSSQPTSAVFFCQTEDQVRFTAYAGYQNPAAPLVKPDKFGTCCMLVVYPSGLSVNVSSSGALKICSGAIHYSPPSPSAEHPESTRVHNLLDHEVSRIVGADGTISRSFPASCPISKEILQMDGSRYWFNRFYSATAPALVTAAPSIGEEGEGAEQQPEPLEAINIAEAFASDLTPFQRALLADAPENWCFVHFHVSGRVAFHMRPIDAILGGAGDAVVSHPTMKSLRSDLVDAETKSVVSVYDDGRMVVTRTDMQREVLFSDGTTIVTHSSGDVVNISKANLPTVEMDLSIDNMCRSHSRGIEVPINKGGERVRSRIALPDGTAVMIKYDTRVTAACNGSIKAVRRDRTTMLVRDDGSIVYTPRTAWDDKADAAFKAECLEFDAVKPAAAATARKSSFAAAGKSTKNVAVTETGSLAGASMTDLSARQTAKTTAAAATAAKALKNKKHAVFTERPASPPKEQAPSPELTPKAKTQDIKITANFLNCTCRIQDYEFNVFDVDLLHDPLEPKITLSGEVEGLKPPAISENPMEPRVFVVNRAAEAVEVVSGQEFHALENLVENCPDVRHDVGTVHLQPSELGPAKMHRFFLQRRLLGAFDDGFTFEGVFGARSWLHQKQPAAALHALRFKECLQYTRRELSAPPPRCYEIINLMEQPPLSQQGFAQLTRDIARCEDFRQNRLQSIDRFAVDDKRTPEEVEEDEAMTKRLKQAYRIAKANAAKRKEQRQKERRAESPNIPGELEVSVAQTIPEGQNEDEDADEGTFADDEDQVETDPVELEIRETFNDFAITANDGWSSEPGQFIPTYSLQDALIRLFNRFVPVELIEKGLINCGDYDTSVSELTLSEFRSLYRSVEQFLAGANPDDLQDFDSPASPKNNFGPSLDSVSVHSGDHHYHSNVSSPTYWQSNIGQKNIRSLPPSAPPLDLRKLDWGNQDSDEEQQQKNSFASNGVEEEKVNSSRHIAGSALNAARNKK